MAKKSVIARNKKRTEMVEKFQDRRLALKKIIADQSVDFNEKMKAVETLNKLPRDSSRVRLVHRCELTGRPRGVYSKFHMCRNMLRLHAMWGDIPGLVKSSW